MKRFCNAFLLMISLVMLSCREKRFTPPQAFDIIQLQGVNLGFSSMYLSAFSANEGIKTFYLQVAGKIDTLFVDVVRVQDHGCTYYRYNQVLFNGKEPPRTDGTGIYKLYR